MCSTPTEAVEQVLAAVGGVDEEILALIELRDRAEAALVRRFGVFDGSGDWKDDGASSPATWVRARADIARGDAQRMGYQSRLLATMPLTSRALDDGTVSMAKARLLIGVLNDRTRDRFHEHEGLLLDRIRDLDVDQTRIVLDHWKRMADTDGPDPSDPDRNRATISTGWGGRWHFEADLDPGSGAIVKAAIVAITDRMHQDGRFTDLGEHDTSARRTADAFVEMAHRSTGRTPEQGSVQAKVIVVVPWERLLERQADPLAPPPELLGTGPVDLTDIVRLTLRGTVAAMTVDADGVPLNLGREVRLASEDQWIALKVRDRGCVVPGCDRPAEWCSAHHLRWWDRDGGPTDLDNLCLVCSHHHHLIHDQHWTLTPGPHHSWTLTRPNGTTVDPPRYPGHPPPPRARPAA
jgi:hypothetical protein